MEVDKILMDLPPPPPSSQFSSLPRHTHSLTGGLLPLHRHDDRGLRSNLEGIHKEEQQLKVHMHTHMKTEQICFETVCHFVCEKIIGGFQFSFPGFHACRSKYRS